MRKELATAGFEVPDADVERGEAGNAASSVSPSALDTHAGEEVSWKAWLTWLACTRTAREG